MIGGVGEGHSLPRWELIVLSPGRRPEVEEAAGGGVGYAGGRGGGGGGHAGGEGRGESEGAEGVGAWREGAGGGGAGGRGGEGGGAREGGAGQRRERPLMDSTGRFYPEPLTLKPQISNTAKRTPNTKHQTPRIRNP